MCLRIESVLVVENETSEDVFNNDLYMCRKETISVSENNIGLAY